MKTKIYFVRHGETVWNTERRYQGWTDIDLLQTLESTFNLPVYVEHDANAGAMAEWLYGNLEDSNNCIVYVLTGDGVGAGIIDRGSLFLGNNGIAGQFGHISLNINGPRCACGNYGCLELYCSTYALGRNAQSGLSDHPDSILSQTKTITWETVFDGAENEDAFCVDLLSDLGRKLGCGIVNLINAYDPKYIIIDGLYAQKKSPVLMFAIKDIICKRVLPEIYQNLIVQYSEQPVFSVLRGAAAIATNGLLSDPNRILNS